MLQIKELSPIYDKPEYSDEIERRIVLLLRDEIYYPVLKEINAKKSVLANAYSDLIDSIASGQIQYVNGHFEGSFNAVLSRELKKLGATWDRKHGWWKISQSELTADMRGAIGVSESRFKQMAAKIDKKLGELLPKEISEKLKFENLFDKTIWTVNKEFEDSVKSITVAPKLTQYQRERISTEYTHNMQLYIQEFTEKEIVKLRQEVQTHVQSGQRYESLVKSIRDSYGVSQSKAKFLARQETSLLVTKFAQTRYTEIGVNEYRWQCVTGTKAHPVRPWHKKHNGKTFTWTNPPQTDEHRGRKNPGQDFGCRCRAIPRVKF